MSDLLTTLNNLAEDHTCYRCDKPLPEGEFLNDGVTKVDQYAGCSHVNIEGGYAMFHDNVELDCVIKSDLCHDCTVELFRFMKFDPRTMHDMRALHPYMDANGESQDTPCCEYGWGSVMEEGKWVGITYGFDPETVHLHKENTE